MPNAVTMMGEYCPDGWHAQEKGGYWNKLLGVLGDLGAVFSFVSTVTIIPFMPGGWNAFPSEASGQRDDWKTPIRYRTRRES
jgi:hypothetical protein